MKSGFSLLELMVAMAIGGIGCVALMHMSTAQIKVDKKVKERLELVELRALIHQRVECGPTVHFVCKLGMKQLISAKGELAWTYRPDQRHIVLSPKCTNGNVYVDYSYERNDLPDPDPVTGRVVPPRPLFAGPLCVRRNPVMSRRCQPKQKPVGYDFDTKRYLCSDKL